METAATKPPPRTAVLHEIFKFSKNQKSTQSNFNTSEELVQLTGRKEGGRIRTTTFALIVSPLQSLDDMDESERVCLLKCIRSGVHGHAEEIAKEFLQLDDVFEEVRRGRR